MKWSGDSGLGRPFAKDRSVVTFLGHHLLYFSLPAASGRGWNPGIAAGRDLIDWEKPGELPPEQDCERNEVCVPRSRVIAGRIYLFNQTYANGRDDAIRHVEPTDGVRFTNPLLPAGKPGECNAFESKHPGVFLNTIERRIYTFVETTIAAVPGGCVPSKPDGATNFRTR